MEYALEGDLKSFGRGFTVLEKVLLPSFPVCTTSRCHGHVHGRPCPSSWVQVVEGCIGTNTCACADADACMTSHPDPSSQTITGRGCHAWHNGFSGGVGKGGKIHLTGPHMPRLSEYSASGYTVSGQG